MLDEVFSVSLVWGVKSVDAATSFFGRNGKLCGARVRVSYLVYDEVKDFHPVVHEEAYSVITVAVVAGTPEAVRTGDSFAVRFFAAQLLDDDEVEVVSSGEGGELFGFVLDERSYIPGGKA